MTASFIFRSTGQCLHVAFLMEILPATQRSFMQAMLEAHMKACGIWEEPKATERIAHRCVGVGAAGRRPARSIARR